MEGQGMLYRGGVSAFNVSYGVALHMERMIDPRGAESRRTERWRTARQQSREAKYPACRTVSTPVQSFDEAFTLALRSSYGALLWWECGGYRKLSEERSGRVWIAPPSRGVRAPGHGNKARRCLGQVPRWYCGCCKRRYRGRVASCCGQSAEIRWYWVVGSTLKRAKGFRPRPAPGGLRPGPEV